MIATPGGANPTPVQNPPTDISLPVAPHFSLTAIVAACCAGLGLAVTGFALISALSHSRPPWELIAVLPLLVLLSLATVLGWRSRRYEQLHAMDVEPAALFALRHAALGAAIVLGERLPPIGYAGAALIFIAIILVETVPVLVARGRRVEQPAGGV